MQFMLITLGFVIVVTACMILINRWMVARRPTPESIDADSQEQDGPR